ncbi:MAG: hypothetical protein ACI37T_09185 [Candidatus Gastranaerophilaceae bacterium]
MNIFKIINIIIKFIRKTGNTILCIVIGSIEAITREEIIAINGKDRTLKDKLMDFIVGLFILEGVYFVFIKNILKLS